MNESNPFCLANLDNGWVVGRFPALQAIPGLSHLVTTRRGLDVYVAELDRGEAARQVAAAMGLTSVAFVAQVHGNDVLRVERGGIAGQADGLITDRPGLGVMCVSADCPLILAADSGGSAVGVAHASWRGTVRQMSLRLIERMKEEYACPPSRIVACICPSAGPQRYEVGPDVLAAARAGLGPAADSFFHRRDRSTDGKMLLDLWSANREQLVRAGVPDESIHIAGICTMERNDLFPSYRMEGDCAGRFVAAIGRR